MTNEQILNAVLSLQEAALLCGLKSDSTLRKALAAGRFSPNEYRKTGKNYIILKSAIERVYNKKDKES